jgi:hypothetical protein
LYPAVAWRILASASLCSKSELLILTNVCPAFTFVYLNIYFGYIPIILVLKSALFSASIFPLALTNGLLSFQKRHLLLGDNAGDSASRFFSLHYRMLIKGN